MLSASVIVCTHNRAAKLSKCLESIAEMTTPRGITWEIICIDNNSTDDTKRVIEEFASTSTIAVRHLFEPRRGTSNARNSGLKYAQSPIIAITDDDCLVDRCWLAEILREFQDSSIDALGGRVELHNKLDLPMSVVRSLERKIFTPVSVFNAIPSCNLAVRRSTVERVGLFDPDFGPGSPIEAAEDTDLVYRMAKLGMKIVYSPNILVYHDHGRRGNRDMQLVLRAYLRGRGAVYMKYLITNDRLIMKFLYWEVLGLCKDMVKNIRNGNSPKAELLALLNLASGGISYARLRIGKTISRMTLPRCHRGA